MVDTTSSIPSAHGAAAHSEHEVALQLSEEAVLDEESSPFDADADDQPVLFVQLLDRDLVPLSKVEVVVSGAGIPTTRSLRTEADGTLLVEDCGPGVYDIHSPRVPEVGEMTELLQLARQRLSDRQLWINPDCGLKTSKWDEVRPALVNMVHAAQELRAAARH